MSILYPTYEDTIDYTLPRKHREESSLTQYKINLRKYYDENKDEICRDYMNWLEDRLFNGDVPVKP